MSARLKIGIIGDFDKKKISHVKTNQCLEEFGAALGVSIDKQWVATNRITGESVRELEVYDGVWAAPGDYSNPPGAIIAIQYAREHKIPFIGT